MKGILKKSLVLKMNNLNDKEYSDLNDKDKIEYKKAWNEWMMANNLLKEIKIPKISKELYSNLKDGYLKGKISYTIFCEWFKLHPENVIENEKGQILNFYDKIDLAKKFIEIQPIYYESKNRYWVWNFKNFFWEVKDETDILNLIYIASGANTINSKEKNEILEGIKQVGRLNKPKDIRSSWVQFRDNFYDVENNDKIKVSHKFFCSNPIDWHVGESEETPKITKLINSWVSEEDREKLWQLIAFSIVPEYFIHSFFFLYSEPGSGKSTFTNLLIKFLGKQNCVSTSIDRINNNVRFETINWHKKLLITLSEVNNVNDLRNSGTINQATGEDNLRAEIKGSGSFDFVNYGKFVYPTNKLLKVSSEDGFGRRVRVIKFTNRFEKEENVLGEIPDWEFNNLAKKCLRIAGELYEKRRFVGDMSISKRMENYQNISKTKVEEFVDTYCSNQNFENKMLFDEFFAKYTKNTKNSESKISVSKQLRKLGYVLKRENWKVFKKNSTMDFEWESGFRISGISWND